MAPKAVVRNFRAFTLHGHGSNNDVINYVAFMDALREIPAVSRQARAGDEVVAVAQVFEEEGVWFLRCVRGREGELPLYYDVATGQEREGDVRKNEVLAGAALFAFDPATRFVVAEQRRPGVGAIELARALSRIGRQAGFDSRLTITLTPVVRSEDFESELGEYERIKAVSVVVTRPNYDWDDNAVELTELASESNAGKAELTMTASRGQSLERHSGIIQQVRDLLASARTPVQDVKLTGRRAGSSQDTSVRLGKHAEKAEVQLPEAGATADREGFLRLGARSFLDRLRERYGLDV